MKMSEAKGTIEIDAKGMYYRDLNRILRKKIANGVKKIKIHNVYGQRYIGTDLDGEVGIEIFGTPGNDLAAFMNGPQIIVHGNAQDGCGNTMNNGEIIIHGHAGDITGYSMRGGRIFVRDDVGYRVGIHMKEYLDKKPILVIGGTAQDFLGEYMAGGILIILGLNLKKREHYKANFIGTGMHGGVMFIRGEVEKHQLGKEIVVLDPDEKDHILLQKIVGEFSHCFSLDAKEILQGKFVKLLPLSTRPYGRIYAY